MAKFKPYNYDQLVMLPLSLEDQLVLGTLEYTINELVEKHIDLSVFEGRYQNDETGATAFNPKILLKVILFAYSRGMISSRQMERACAENIQTDSLPGRELERQQKQERRLPHQVERLNRFLHEEKPKIGKGGEEIQSNVTDNQSAKMPSSHGVIQGYNAQALVDAKHQVIVPAEAFSSQDPENLAPVIAGAKKNIQAIGKDENYFRGKQLTADSNYHSYDSMALCKAESLDAYIPDIQFRKRDERFAEQDRFKDGLHPRQPQASKTRTFPAADFSFDASKQTYLCPQGKELIGHARSQRNRYRLYNIYHARQQDCACCPVKSQCLRNRKRPSGTFPSG